MSFSLSPIPIVKKLLFKKDLFLKYFMIILIPSTLLENPEILKIFPPNLISK